MQANSRVKEIGVADFAGFSKYLTSDNDVLRSAAVRALPALSGEASGDVRAAVLAARLDPDPDVRTDAMEALVYIAQPEDADDIRHSLEGDPVREVKVSAITALARLQDLKSLPLLRSLTVSRSDSRVAWEDEGGDWEDWLDIQNVAIKALGDMAAEDAVSDLLVALNDELGQSVDLAVFKALTNMGEVGVSALLEVLQSATGIKRRRAAEALSRAAPKSLAAHVGTLLQADEAPMRRLALTALSADDPLCEDLALNDEDAGVRAAALVHSSGAFADLARLCLADPSDVVKAAALQCLKPPFEPAFQEALVDNMLVWLDRAGPAIAMEAAAQLPVLSPLRATAPLLLTIEDTNRPLEVRVAAVKGLGTLEAALPLEELVALLENPARQVRAAVLTVLRARADCGEAAALQAVVSAISGDLFEVSQNVDAELEATEANMPDAGTPKEGAGPRRIWITPEGDIVERDDTDEASGEAKSTLDAIMSEAAGVPQPKMAEDTPEESRGKRAKRRAVEGSEELTLSLACDTMRIFGDFESSEVTEALMARAEDADETLRRAAWHALPGRALPESILPIAQAGFADSDPTIRMVAFRILADMQVEDIVSKGLTDEDPLIRAETVSRLPVDVALDKLGDGSSAVRQMAVRRILDGADSDQIGAAVDRSLVAERSDTLAALIGRSNTAKRRVLATLADPDGTARRALVILQGLEASGANS